MEEQLVTLETGKLAKEKGFNVPVVNFYIKSKKPYVTTGNEYQSERDAISNWNNGQGSYPTLPENVECSAPTQSLLQRWLREAHNLNVWVSSKTTDKGNTIFIPHGRTIPDTIKKGLVKDVIAYKTFDNNEEALEFGLQEALKLIE